MQRLPKLEAVTFEATLLRGLNTISSYRFLVICREYPSLDYCPMVAAEAWMLKPCPMDGRGLRKGVAPACRVFAYFLSARQLPGYWQ